MSSRIRNLTTFDPKRPQHVTISDSNSDSKSEGESEPVLNNSKLEIETMETTLAPKRLLKLPLQPRAKIMKHTKDMSESVDFY